MAQMISDNHKEWVLETIDQLRQRKARPDMERISHMLQRKRGLKSEETQAIVDKLVEAEIIYKVDYKGNTSYRNAEKWSQNQLGGQVINSNTASSRISNAIRELTKDGYRQGASANEIEKWLISKSPDTRLVKNRLRTALQRELDTGNVERLSDGSFTLRDLGSEVSKEKGEKESRPPTPVQSVAPPILETAREPTIRRGRPPSKRKRIKKTHGPDFESSHGRKEGDIAKCDYCLLSEWTNRNGQPEYLLTCKECNARAHPSCMDYSEELAARARNSPWQCIDCKTCYVCDDSGDAVSMLFCDSCDKGYHMTCHNPPVLEKPTGKWECGVCCLEKSQPADSEVLTKKNQAKKKGENPEAGQLESGEAGTKFDDSGDTEPEEPEAPVQKGTRKRRMRRKHKPFVLKKNRQPSTYQASSRNHVSNSMDSFSISGFTGSNGGASCLPTPSASPTPGDVDESNCCRVQPVHLVENSHGFSSDISGKLGGDYKTSLTCDTGTEEVYPDASKWSIDEVVEYFDKCGFSEQSNAFREQEIDGQSLLLMKRLDVLTGLSIKLGPALKIYKRVAQLQTAGQVLS